MFDLPALFSSWYTDPGNTSHGGTYMSESTIALLHKNELSESKRQKQERWDIRYTRLAQHIAKWSKDPRARVGAVIANPEKGRVIALGFNGFPVGVEDDADRLHDSSLKLKMVVHAEQNALLFAGQMAKGCVIYVAGKPICERCAVLIIQSGITRVVARHPDTLGEDSKWLAGAQLALELFEEVNVEFSATRDRDLGEIQGDEFSSSRRFLQASAEA